MVNTKQIVYVITVIFYYIFYLFPINKNKTLLIHTHDDSHESNVGVTYTYFSIKIVCYEKRRIS